MRQFGSIIKFLCTSVLLLVHHTLLIQLASANTCGQAPLQHGHFDLENLQSSRIVGGLISPRGWFPWQAGLKKIPSSRIFCGCSVLTNFYVLTAGHCLYEVLREETKDHQVTLFVAFGEDKIKQVAEYRQIIESLPGRNIGLFLHENYNFLTLENDIALVKTSQIIIFNDFVQPICLNGNSTLFNHEVSTSNPEGQTNLYVAGWGWTSTNFPDQMRYVDVKYIHHKSCQDWYFPEKVSENMICAGYKFGGKDSCTADSGGLLASKIGGENGKWVQVGIVSWGLNCATAFSPGVYVNISKYLRWILHKSDLVEEDSVFQAPNRENNKNNANSEVNNEEHDPKICGTAPLRPEELDSPFNAYNSKIHGKIKVDRSSFPWLVKIFDCSGTIISKNFVISSASCILRHVNQDSSISGAVEIGQHPFTQKIEMKTTFILPLYKPTSTKSTYDFSLILLSQKIIFTKSVQPICLEKTGQHSDFKYEVSKNLLQGRKNLYLAAQYDGELFYVSVKNLYKSICLKVYGKGVGRASNFSIARFFYYFYGSADA